MKLTSEQVLIRNCFPNFPEELFSLWLDKFVKRLGWPPNKETIKEWTNILNQKRIADWNNLNWRSECIPLCIHDMTSTSQLVLSELVKIGSGENGEYEKYFGENRDRLKHIYSYIVETGDLPNSVILVQEGAQFSIADGHHRLSILFALQGISDNNIHLKGKYSAFVGS